MESRDCPEKILTYAECCSLRGLAIVLILIHNFSHLRKGSVMENEYTWDLSRIKLYEEYIVHGGPDLILNFFSHYGHYGVALFLFLSGYDLVMKYERTEDNFSTIHFLGNHALKMWQIMVPACALYFIAWSIPFGDWKNDLSQLPVFLLFLGNLVPDHVLITGPWWWFSLMMQFYLFYALVVRKCNKSKLTLVALVLLLFQLVMVILQDDLANSHGVVAYLHYNLPYSILPFIMGVWLARYGGGELLLSAKLTIAALFVVVMGSYSPYFWVVASPFAVMIILQGRNLPLSWLGKISAWLFALHPIARYYVYYWLNAHQDPYETIVVYLLLALFMSGVVHVIERKVRAYFDKK